MSVIAGVVADDLAHRDEAKLFEQDVPRPGLAQLQLGFMAVLHRLAKMEPPVWTNGE